MMDDPSLAVGALIDLRQSGAADQASTNIRRAYSSVSNEKRGLIIHAIDTLGWSVTATAKHYQVSQTTVSNIKRVFYTDGGRINKKVSRGRRAPKLSDERAAIIRQWVDNDCLLSLSSIRHEVSRQFGTQISNCTLSRILRAFHYTIKRTSVVAERASSSEVIQSRIDYASEYLAIMSRRENIFFIDETGFCVSMRRKMGRAPRGERAVVHVPAIRTKNFSVCAVYNISSMLHFDIQARPYNTASFLMFVEQRASKIQRA